MFIKQAGRQHWPAVPQNLPGGQNGGVFVKKGVGGSEVIKTQGKTGQRERKNTKILTHARLLSDLLINFYVLLGDILPGKFLLGYFTALFAHSLAFKRVLNLWVLACHLGRRKMTIELL